MDSLKPLPTLRYSPKTCADRRQAARAAVDAALEGYTIEVECDADYVNLVHVLDRRDRTGRVSLVKKTLPEGGALVFAYVRPTDPDEMRN